MSQENTELFHGAVGRLCLQLGEAVGMEVNANMYLTPGGEASRTFPSHVDGTDIFVLQLAGQKRWAAWHSAVYRLRTRQFACMLNKICGPMHARVY
jgi:ribosomal protein L16 Arg81 hydroxylase